MCCSESQLEEVLTVYTRLSRSASVFLNSSSRPSSASDISAAAKCDVGQPSMFTSSKKDKEDGGSTSGAFVKPVKQDKQHGPDDGRKFNSVSCPVNGWNMLCLTKAFVGYSNEIELGVKKL